MPTYELKLNQEQRNALKSLLKEYIPTTQTLTDIAKNDPESFPKYADWYTQLFQIQAIIEAYEFTAKIPKHKIIFLPFNKQQLITISDLLEDEVTFLTPNPAQQIYEQIFNQIEEIPLLGIEP